MEAISIDHITIDPERFTVIRDGSHVTLTKTEFLILYLMMSTRGKVHSRNDISRFAIGSKSQKNTRTIDTHICNIRKKIGKVKDRDIISVIKGVGYKLSDVLAG